MCIGGMCLHHIKLFLCEFSMFVENLIRDGNFSYIVQWCSKKDIVYLFGKDILKRNRAGKEDAIYLKKEDSYEDHNLWIKAFGSTDSGISFLIEAEGKRLFHAGDLNNWHWKDESTPEEVAEAEKNYLKELDDLVKVTDKLDVAMFPVDPRIGTDFMRGAQQFVDHIKTNIFVPMHFDEAYARAAAFRPLAEAEGARMIALERRGQCEEIECETLI